MPIRASIRRFSFALAAGLSFTLPLAAQSSESDDNGESADSFAEAVDGLTFTEGFIDIYSSTDAGKVLALLPAPGDGGALLRFIHALRLRDGLGSNPLGLDRGWGNSGRIIRLRRVGDRVVAEVENHRYRADTDNELERSAVASSFATSFIWSTEVVAEDDHGRPLIDLAGFLAADQLGLVQRLAEDNGGNGSNGFSRAADRSFPDAASALVFPDNVEIDAWLTLTSSKPGPEVSATAADPNAVTLVQHHSFVRLPDDGYRTRRADPRTGTFALGFHDFAAPLDDPIVRGYAMRHRLQYNEPGDPESGVRDPIVFHIDPGAPAAIRDALAEGASWWREAFAAAGFADGFRVELLPEGAHPLDIRYNVVQWVHRQTRGWSYGGGIIDPRTGEIIKGHVILGSQRVRQDRMIFEGLAGVERVGTGADDDPVELALDRIRQLAAHEVGHALGFGHNFAASFNDRASVMDYPAPWVHATGSGLDFSRAYDTGIGEWDRLTAEWLYREFPDAVDPEAELDALVERAIDNGLLFVADQHARSVSTAHPKASVWDNGSDAIAELRNVLKVREHALNGFGADRIAEGRPLAALREVLTPIYLYHRYQIDAAAKLLGGVEFAYATRGGPVRPVRAVAPARQRKALEALLSTLRPAALRLPERLLEILPPRYDGFWFRVPDESLPARTAPAFDLLTAAETAAELTFAALLDPVRAERLVQQHALNADSPSPAEVMRAIEARVFEDYRAAGDDLARGIAQRVLDRYTDALMRLEAGSGSGQVRAAARGGLERMKQRLSQERRDQRDIEIEFNQWLANRIQKQLERDALARDPAGTAPDIPPGSPIGTAPGIHTWLREDCWHCKATGR